MIIVDVAQSLGIRELPFGEPDVLIGSVHKWLYGPHGGGLIWMKQKFRDWLGALYWNGNNLHKEPGLDTVSMSGGHDFMLYPAILAALKLYQQTGKEEVFNRSKSLASHFAEQLRVVLHNSQINYAFLSDNSSLPVISIGFHDFDPFQLYRELCGNKVHIKCIKYPMGNGNEFSILRFGVPYYETKVRLDMAVREFDRLLNQSVSSNRSMGA
jgi:UDP-sulfoquinovose synthase